MFPGTEPCLVLWTACIHSRKVHQQPRAEHGYLGCSGKPCGKCLPTCRIGKHESYKCKVANLQVVLLLLLLLRCPAYLCGGSQAAAESRRLAQQSRGSASA